MLNVRFIGSFYAESCRDVATPFTHTAIVLPLSVTFFFLAFRSNVVNKIGKKNSFQIHVDYLTTGLVGGVVIEPQNPVVRLGQTARLMCKVRGPIKSCLWEINGELYNLQEGAKYQPFGVHQDGECGIQVTIVQLTP